MFSFSYDPYMSGSHDSTEVASALERTLCRFLAYGDAGADENATGDEYLATLL